MRLQQTFSRCLFEFDGEFFFEFSPKKKQLSYVLDLGVDRDPDFSGPVRASLFLNSESSLVIDYFSIQNPDKKRTEVLIKDVKDIDFYFYDISHQKWTKNKLNENDILPKMLKVIVQKNSQKIDFAYIFAQNNPIIIKI